MFKVMAKSCRALAALPLLLAVPAEAQVLGTDAAACAPNTTGAGASGPAVLVTVIGFKNRDGRLRVQFYPDEQEDYLGSGKYIRRQEVPVTASGNMQVCITVPRPGSYVMVALHDRNEDGKLNVWSDGIGFSNNPRIPLGKPPLEKTRFTAGPGITRIDVVLNYMQGLSPRPIRQK
ncbi:hypothetical protein GCM10007973_00350 [Polymorphobacter multimanifer]|nr:DUF2141 domain-containing protein [Polymorphobacter multimanifer]GGI67145.1 hypothetical protein GCM10007973_00350 [Polymorphobacter multimanifer]